MKSLFSRLTSIAFLLGFAAFGFANGALAAPGGNGNGNGNGGGGGSQSPDLGDLIVVLRGDNGVPDLDENDCEQPLAAPGVTVESTLPNPPPDSYVCTPSPDESCTIPVDPDTCAVVPGYESYTQEVDFGRSSVVRSPSSVLDSQLDDVVVNLSTADCTSLDPAGRFVTSVVTSVESEDGTTFKVTSAEIDSPLQNLAIYRQLMLTGYLGSETAPIQLPGQTDDTQGVLTTAARALGAVSDKTGKVTVDMVVYLNQILGLTDESVQTYLGKICQENKEEVQGVVQMVRKCYLDYNGFSYDRDTNFNALPYPAYIPADSPVDGEFEYLSVLDASTPSFQITQGSILSGVPQLADDTTFTADKLDGFAQAADDARAVIDYMHTWPVPGNYATSLKCETSGETGYDVSISSDSGLQVPKRMVAGTEGREYSVTVANAGPDAATGDVEVTATGHDNAGNDIPVLYKTFAFSDLAPGASQTWTDTVSISKPTDITSITWTATVVAPHDANLNNNSVDETTTVMSGGGGGGE